MTTKIKNGLTLTGQILGIIVAIYTVFIVPSFLMAKYMIRTEVDRAIEESNEDSSNERNKIKNAIIHNHKDDETYKILYHNSRSVNTAILPYIEEY